jgi:alcohol dehydrogenase
MNVFVTGSSSGLGHALVDHYLSKGEECFGLSRSTPENAALYRFEPCDVARPEAIEHAMEQLFEGVKRVDLVYLNAGTLGRIQDMSACGLDELKRQMDINLWANKVILDFFISHAIEVGQVVAISSGASVNGSLGWNGYSLSKAALNMMMKLYAREMTGTHLCALAPGLIETPMLGSILYGDHDTQRYTSVQVLRDAKESGGVMRPDEAAAAIDGVLETVRTRESGAFLDIRQM